MQIASFNTSVAFQKVVITYLDTPPLKEREICTSSQI